VAVKPDPADVPDLGDRALAIPTPRTAGIHVDRDDELVLVMVETATSDVAPTKQVHRPATEAARRI